MKVRLWPIIGLVGLNGLATAACGPAEAAPSATIPPPDRTIRSIRWIDSRVPPGSAPYDTIFRAPTQPVAFHGGLVLADSYTGRVTHLGRDGSILWSVTPAGATTAAGSIRDVELAPDGRLWVLDQSGQQAIVLDSAGAVVARAGLESAPGPLLSLLPSDNGLTVHTGDPRAPLVKVRQASDGYEQVPVPWDSLRQVHALAAQLMVERRPDGGWVAGLLSGNGFFVFDASGSSAGRRRYVEDVAFPRIQTTVHRKGTRTVSVSRPQGRPVNAALSLAASPLRVYVLFSGSSAHRHRIVDAYSIATGEYLESYILPRRTAQISWDDGALVTISYEPNPVVRRLRPANGALP